MQANACVVSLERISSQALVNAVERALVASKGTVYVDLRSIPAASKHAIDMLGNIYGSVAKVAPQRNVVPLLSSAYSQGNDLSIFGDRNKVLHFGNETETGLGNCSPHRERCDRSDRIVLSDTVFIPQDAEQHLPCKNVALGGTFDRLHAGHRLLLAAAAAVTTGNILVGLADNKLLADKHLRELIQDYDDRLSNVKDFLQAVCPHVDPIFSRLEDPHVPTKAETDPSMNALVVSGETMKGGVKINKGRTSRGFPELLTVVVPVLGAMSEGEKLSSTTLREADMQKRLVE